MCYTSSYGLDDVFRKVKKLDWVKEVKPDVPTSKNGWGKRSSDYHLNKDFGIQLKVDGTVVHEWKWENQREAGSKSVPDKYWDEFVKKAEAQRTKKSSAKSKSPKAS